MNAIVRQLGQRVLGALSGFDRLLFRGFLRCVINPRGLNGYLYGAKVPMAKFGEHALEVTAQLIDESTRHARETGREIRYLESSDDRKKDIAEEIAHRDRIDKGLICVLKCVEPCTTLRVRGNRETKKIAIQRERGKCLHLYHYFIHPQFGFMHVRLQTWFPFTMQICLNGREWLARDLTTAGIGFRRHWMNGNSLKIYNKPSVLRIETTINHPKEFKAFRVPENASPDAQPEWLRVRKGVADLYRRAEVSQASNDRLAAAQAAVLSEDATPLKELTADLCRRVVRPGREKSDGSRTRPRTFRGLNPLAAEDLQLLALVSQPKFEVSGMRNQDLRPSLFPNTPNNPQEQRRQASAVSRKLAILRAHGLLEKVSKSHRYRLTEKGRQGLTALLAAANASTSKLTSLASSLAA